MTDVLLGQSYYLRFDAKLWEAMQPYPPLGTLYAASYLRERGYDVGLFDAMLATDEHEWADALDQHQPRFAVLFEDNFNYLSKMCLLRMREAAFKMINMARERDLTVIVCGADSTDHSRQYLDAGADYVIFGEGEQTLTELLGHLTDRESAPLDSILGLIYRDDSIIKRNPPRSDLKQLDALPFPAWDLVDIPRYQAVWHERHGYYSMNMVTTRGCPFHCNWCAKPIWGQRYNARSPENVAEELRWLKDQFKPDHIWFVDDIMGLKPGWMDRFANAVEKLDAQVPFKCLNRVDLLLRGDTVEALARAGARTVWVGAESGSQKILDAMEKGTKVEQIYEAARRLHDAGIEVGFFLQFGYPGEEREDIEMTLQMVRDCQPDDIGMSVSYPLPGTKFHNAVRDQLGVQQNWLDSNDLAMLYKGPFATEFYRQLHIVLHKEYRARKYWRGLQQVIRQPSSIRPNHIRDLAAMTKHALTLPLARQKLRKFEKLPHKGLRTIPLQIDPAAAARPSPQSDP